MQRKTWSCWKVSCSRWSRLRRHKSGRAILSRARCGRDPQSIGLFLHKFAVDPVAGPVSLNLNKPAWSPFNFPLLTWRIDPRTRDICKELKAPQFFLRGGKARHVQFRAFVAMLDPIALRFTYHRDAVLIRLCEDLCVFFI